MTTIKNTLSAEDGESQVTKLQIERLTKEIRRLLESPDMPAEAKEDLARHALVARIFKIKE